jgi:RNA polymerase sigma factor (sigma-70 family)
MVVQATPRKTLLAEQDDSDLASMAGNGQHPAFQTLVERHQRALRLWLRRADSHPESIDDIAQEAFLRAWRNLGRWDRSGSFRSWLFKIALNVAADTRRSRHRDRARDTVWAKEHNVEPSHPAAALEAALDVDNILAALSPEPRKVVALCYGAGFSHQEAADALDLPLGTVKSHLSRARTQSLSYLESNQQSRMQHPPQQARGKSNE